MTEIQCDSIWKGVRNWEHAKCQAKVFIQNWKRALGFSSTVQKSSCLQLSISIWFPAFSGVGKIHKIRAKIKEKVVLMVRSPILETEVHKNFDPVRWLENIHILEVLLQSELSMVLTCKFYQNQYLHVFLEPYSTPKQHFSLLLGIMWHSHPFWL